MNQNTSRRLKQLAGAVIMIATLAFFIYYWRSHPEIVTQLRSVSLLAIVAIIAMYAAMTLLLALIYDVILQMCGKRISFSENSLLTAYSSIINFFGPLQSGPGFRTLYLKQRHNVPMTSYVTGTLVYYGLFGIINLAFLALGLAAMSSAPLLLPLMIFGFVAIGSIVRYAIRRLAWLARFRPYVQGSLFARLAVLTFLQASLAAAIYMIELHAIGFQASLIEAIAYAGAGSLALFVSLTPGALGFRESFQYISQSVHHVDNNAIVAANLLDRSAYIAFLAGLFLIIIGFHAQKRLTIDKNTDNT